MSFVLRDLHTDQALLDVASIERSYVTATVTVAGKQYDITKCPLAIASDYCKGLVTVERLLGESTHSINLSTLSSDVLTAVVDESTTYLDIKRTPHTFDILVDPEQIHHLTNGAIVQAFGELWITSFLMPHIPGKERVCFFSRRSKQYMLTEQLDYYWQNIRSSSSNKAVNTADQWIKMIHSGDITHDIEEFDR